MFRLHGDPARVMHGPSPPPTYSPRSRTVPRLTVVVVDDAPDYREIVRLLLRRLPDMVTMVAEAEHGEEGLAVVLRERPDMVITDLVMPRLDGVELTRRIRQELPQTTIILMSSHTEDAYRLLASDSGADAFVNKGVIFEALVPAIRDLIGRRLSGGSGPLPPSIGTSASAASPK
jgi:DNA-binding NarL/FixJ family response regulator